LPTFFEECQYEYRHGSLEGRSTTIRKMRLFFALICLTAVAYAQSSTPAITSASPNPIDAGGPAFTLTVSVSAFVPAAVVKWSGTPLVTTYVNDNTLNATVPAVLIAICGKYFLTVTNPQNNAVSNSYPVIVNPVLKSISPNLLPAGSGGTTVTASGLGFSSNVYLTLIASGSRSNLATAYGGSTTLTAFVPASALNGIYPVSLFVADPTTGAVSQTLPITLTYASVSAVFQGLYPTPSPNTIYADIASYSGATSFPLVVQGANFIPGAQVLWNGAPLVTAYNAADFLTATVPADLVHNASADNKSTRLVGVSVKNPGAAASNSINLVILPNPFGTTIISLTPPSAVAGGPGLTLTVTGERYVQGSTVLWFRTPLPTTFVSATQLTATIPVDRVATENVATITVSTPGIADSNSLNFPIIAVSPSISKISPDSAIAGGPAFTMTVNGDGFIPASQVTGLAGATTTYVSLNQLTVSVPASAIANVGSHAIQVVSPGPLVSPQAPVFAVKAPTPAITSLIPASVLVGGPDFTLTVNGSNFLSSATVAWNGAALPTTRVSATQLTAIVSAALIAASGTAKISVFNEGPVSSGELALSIASTPVASLASLSPSSAVPGGADFTLTVTGAAFTANSIVQWNGAPLVTTFIGASQLTARVSAALIATAGTASVTVAGNSGPSNALPFTIAPLAPGTSSAGILNAASSLPAIAPGTLIAIYGSNLAAATAQFSAAPLPVLLGGTSVTINGTPAPLLYVSPGQVNAQVPYETKVGTAKLVVTSNGVPSPAVNFEVAATGPGVFTPQQSNHVLALNLADGTLNASQTPARPGQYVTAYLTGQGLVDPAVTTGDVAPSSPFSLPVAPVTVKIGGVAAVIRFAGLAPGFIDGLLQMNVLIPDVPPGELSFDVSIGAVAAAPTVISVASKAP
jgi:uncharacterized protein (TIGR03437 family)